MEAPRSAPYMPANGRQERRAAMSEESAAPVMMAASNRERAIEALMSLLVENPIEQIGLNDIAERAHLSLSDLRADFSSVHAILAGFMKDLDRQVLETDTSDMTNEPARERLFELLMRRLELLTPHKAAIRSLMRSSLRNPALALAMGNRAAQSMSWMMEAAGISSAGIKGGMRAHALSLLYARVLTTWMDDNDPGLARTMSALDRELARAQSWSGFLDTLWAIPERLQEGRARARRKRTTNPDDEIIAA
jgi:AcrR family transcriptional regulator